VAKPHVRSGGGLAAILYTLRKGREAGGLLRLYRRMRTRNACKTCALGMGGQAGGMVNELGSFPEVCKKSVQAQAGDMQAPIDEGFFASTPISTMASFSSAKFESLGRLVFPVIAEPGDSHFRRLSWDEALGRTAVALCETQPERTFFYASGRSSNEAAYLFQLVARAYGTNNVHNCSYYCHAASGVALSQVYGSGTASLTVEDLDQADFAIVAGANPASNHPRLMTKLVQLRRRGGKVMVINPLRELGLERFRVPSDWRSMLFGSKIADLYVQPHIGGDTAWFKAVLKSLLESESLDYRFIERASSGWQELAADLSASSWNELVAAAGVSRYEVDRAAQMIADAERGVCMWAMGLTHHVNGVDNVLALSNIALARGWLGRPGAGLLPLRGHSNVQGVGSCGVTPKLKQAFGERMEQLYGFKLPEGPGQDTYASMLAAHAGDIDACLLLGGNLFASNPDRAWTSVALRRIGLSCSVATKLNEGHVIGRGRTAIILPALARDEEDQATTQESMFNYVRVSDGGNPLPDGELRSEVGIIAALAERVLPAAGVNWRMMQSHRHLREEMARVVPGYGGLAQVDDERREFQIDGRTFHEPRFATADGKAGFFVTGLPHTHTDSGEFRLMTLRSEGQFNTVVYDEEDLYRGNTRRDVVMISADDASELGLREGDPVVVDSEVGAMVVNAAIVDIRPGNLAMYYPEANALVPRIIDPASKTPAFKCVRVRLKPVATAAAGG